MNIALLIPLIQGIIAAAPEIASAVKSVKDFVQSLASSKVITVEQQNALHEYVDGCQSLALAGIRPDAWIPRPDPTPAP